jgi:hypothetical protein
MEPTVGHMIITGENPGFDGKITRVRGDQAEVWTFATSTRAWVPVADLHHQGTHPDTHDHVWSL